MAEADGILKDLHERAIKCFNEQRFEKALDAAQSLVSASKAQLGERHPVVEQALLLHGQMREACGEPEEAERLFREALSIRRFFVGAKDPVLVSSLNRLAGINLALNRVAIAEPLIREAMDICESLPPGQRPIVALPLMYLARVHLHADRREDALASAQEALEAASADSENQPQLRDLQADVRLLLAEIHQRSHDIEAGVAEMREALTIKRELYGLGNGAVVNTLSELARLLSRLGDHEQADEMLVGATESMRAAIGEVTDEMLGAIHALASLRSDAGHRDEADRLLDAADDLRAAGDLTPLGAVQGLTERAELLESTGEIAAAAPLRDKAVEMVEAIGKAVHPTLIGLLTFTGMYRETLGRSEEALRLADRGLSLLERVEGAHEAAIQLLLRTKGEALRELGRHAEAKATFERLKSIRSELRQSLRLELDKGLPRCLEDSGDLNAALDEYRQLLQAAESSFGPDAPSAARIRHAAALIMARKGDRRAAAAEVHRSMKGTTDSLLRDHRGDPLDSITDHFWASECVMSLTTLAFDGSAPPDATLMIASMLARMQIVCGPSDLQLAQHERPEQAPLVQAIIHAERQLGAALSELDDGRVTLAVKQAARFRQRLVEAEDTARKVLPGLDRSLRVWNCEPEEVWESLGPDGVFVQFILVTPPDFDRPPGTPELFTPDRYAALVISRRHQRVIDLGEAAELNNRVASAITGDIQALAAVAEKLWRPLELTGEGRLWIAANSQLAGLPFEAMPDHSGGTLSERWDVLRVPSLDALIGRRPPPDSKASGQPLALIDPELDPIPDDPRERLRFVGPPRSTRWRRLAMKIGLVSPPRPQPPQLDLSIKWRAVCEASHALRAERISASHRSGAATPPANWRGEAKLGRDASIAAMLAAPSPRAIYIDAPWALLPDQPYAWGNPRDQAWVHRVPPRTVPAGIWHESPYCRAGIFLSTTGPMSPELRRSARGIVTPRAIASANLTGAEWVALAQPPRLPEGRQHPVGDALASLAHSFLSAGAGCVLLPRPHSTAEATRQWFDIFIREAATQPPTAAARKTMTQLRDRGAPFSTWAAVAVFSAGTEPR